MPVHVVVGQSVSPTVVLNTLSPGSSLTHTHGLQRFQVLPVPLPVVLSRMKMLVLSDTPLGL